MRRVSFLSASRSLPVLTSFIYRFNSETATPAVAPSQSPVPSKDDKADPDSSSKSNTSTSKNQISQKIEEMAELYAQLTLREVSQLQRLVFRKLGHSDKFYEEALLRGIGGGGGGFVAAPQPQNVALTAQSVTAAPAIGEKTVAGDGAPAAAGGSTTKKKIEKNTLDVKLVKYPAEVKIKLIKELRTVTNLPLKEAKDAIDKAPGLIQTNMGKEDAQKLKTLFEALGAEIELL